MAQLPPPARPLGVHGTTFHTRSIIVTFPLVMAACGGGPAGAGDAIPAAAPTVIAEVATATAAATEVPFSVIEPASGATVTAAAVMVRGTGPAGARVVHDISMAPDDESTVGQDGTWAIGVELSEGANELEFRLADDKATAITISLLYVPAATTATPTTIPVSAVGGRFTVGSPTSGGTVGTALIEVTGTGPAGAEVVRDISFAPDDRVTVGADGTWAMSVELLEGSNDLTFRLGDDSSTEVTISVAYVPGGVGGGTAGGSNPPSGWSLSVCGAVKQIDDSGDHLAALGQAATDYDIDGMIDEGKKAAQDAAEARDLLADAPSWKPGATVVSKIKAAAQYSLEAANVLVLGAKTLDGGALKEGAALLEDALDAKFAAAAALVELQSDTGFSCFN